MGIWPGLCLFPYSQSGVLGTLTPPPPSSPPCPAHQASSAAGSSRAEKRCQEISPLGEPHALKTTSSLIGRLAWWMDAEQKLLGAQLCTLMHYTFPSPYLPKPQPRFVYFRVQSIVGSLCTKTTMFCFPPFLKSLSGLFWRARLHQMSSCSAGCCIAFHMQNK